MDLKDCLVIVNPPDVNEQDDEEFEQIKLSDFEGFFKEMGLKLPASDSEEDMGNFKADFVSKVAQQGNLMRDKDTLEIVKAKKYDRREARSLAKILSILEAEMARIDPRLLQLFNPGLTPAELEGQTMKGGQPLHPDLVTLYSWHNGLQSDEVDSIFNGYIFPSLSETLASMESLKEFAPDYLFTILEDGSGTSVDLDLRGKKHFKGILSAMDDDLGVLEVYPSINAFFGALLAAFQEGVFKVVPASGPQGEDVLVAKYDCLNRVFAAYQLQDPEYSRYEDADDDADDDDDDFDYEVILPPK